MIQAIQPSTEYPHVVRSNGGEFNFRLMGPGDRQTMLDFAETLPEEDMLFLRMDIKNPKVIQEWIDSVESGLRFTVLAEDKGRMVGYGSLNRQTLNWTRHLAEIRIIVHRDYRNAGLGAALAKEIFNVAQEMKLTKIVAQMASEQRGARRMFERLGFTAEALLTDWVIDRQGRMHDLIIMSYDVMGLTD